MKASPHDPGRRRLLTYSLPAGLSFAAGLAHGGVANIDSTAENSTSACPCFRVTDFGARGDGNTPSADAFQRAIDAAEAAGGGVVQVPTGVFILERTPLIASKVHLIGCGPSSVLRGERPSGYRGAALISNKGQQSNGYDGASDWSISHLAIDSPKTNGIVITHSSRIYLGFIYGVQVYHHFVDNVGREVLCENLYLTGRSGTSAFQIDSLSGAQTIWDGERVVAPNYDGTQARDLILQNSCITAVAGHNGEDRRHFSSIHFHGERSAGFMFSNLILGGADIGIYQDADSHYEDIQIDNIRSTNRRCAAVFNPGRSGQRGLLIRGLTHNPPPIDKGEPASLDISGHDNVIISDCQLSLKGPNEKGTGVKIVGCRNVKISSIQAEASGGVGVSIDPGPNRDSDNPSDNVLVEGCQFIGFTTGIRAPLDAIECIASASNMFSDVKYEIEGSVSRFNSITKRDKPIKR